MLFQVYTLRVQPKYRKELRILQRALKVSQHFTFPGLSSWTTVSVQTHLSVSIQCGHDQGLRTKPGATRNWICIHPWASQRRHTRYEMNHLKWRCILSIRRHNCGKQLLRPLSPSCPALLLRWDEYVTRRRLRVTLQVKRKAKLIARSVCYQSPQ